MTRTETSVFEITNLNTLSCDYRLYKINGLIVDSDDFDKNVQFLIDRLSSMTSSPCTKVLKGKEVFIAQPIKYRELPVTLQLVRTNVSIEKQQGTYHLEFDNLDSETRPLALRFLQFSIQDGILSNSDMWRPKAGAPFFSKTPDADFRRTSNEIDLYRGFSCRVVALPNKKIGIAIDTKTKFISRNPLPSYITRDEFRKYFKGIHIVYEYGKVWYEEKIHELDDMNVMQRTFNGESLYENVERQYKEYGKTQLFISMPKDCAVVTYRTRLGEARHMPTAMCRIIHDTESIKRGHQYAIAHPEDRRNMLLYIVKTYMNSISFNKTPVTLSRDPFIINAKSLTIPELLFGNGRSLHPNHLPNVSDFCRQKDTLIQAAEAGFFTRTPFGKQYIILPKSVADSYGKRFIEDLKNMVNRLYKPSRQYDPETLTFDDSGKYSYKELGKRILESLKARNPSPGYALVSIPRLQSPRINREDEIASYIMVKFRELSVNAAVIHTDVPKSSLIQHHTKAGPTWYIADDPRIRGKYNGYLKNVALNHVLLLNDMWPFILKTPLKADLVIGIDVKEHSAGFTFISKTGDRVSFIPHKSTCREQLNKHQVKKFVKDFVQKHSMITGAPVGDILVHRDGILFPQEKIGITDAISELKKEGKIRNECGCTFLEIRKSMSSPVRLFEVVEKNSSQKEMVRNPFNGRCVIFGNDAYIVTTGYPFRHEGTSNPLHVIWHGGNMSFEDALQDTFALTHLTWTKIDDCSRVPLTTKIGDIRLRESSGEFDSDSYEFTYDKEGVENE